MQRRQFLQLTAMGGTVFLVTGMSCNQQHSVSYDLMERPDALAQICDMKTLKEIGMAYHGQMATEANADKLASLLLTDSAGHPISSTSDNTFIQDLLSKKIEQDFEKGSIVIVKGWILSVTEARQCALLFLNNP
jgi:uridylate kinase